MDTPIWTFKGETLPKEFQASVDNSPTRSILSITNATTDHGGSYECYFPGTETNYASQTVFSVCVVEGALSSFHTIESQLLKLHDQDHRAFIISHLRTLVDGIDMKNTKLWEDLISGGLIHYDHAQCIKQRFPANRDQVLALLNHLIQRPLGDFQKFQYIYRRAITGSKRELDPFGTDSDGQPQAKNTGTTAMPVQQQEESKWSKRACISSPLPQKAKTVKQDTVKTTGYSARRKGFQRTPMLKSSDMEDLRQNNPTQGDLGSTTTEGEKGVDFFQDPFGNLEAHRQTDTADFALEDLDHILEIFTQEVQEYKQEESTWSKLACISSPLPQKAKGVKQDTVKITDYSERRRGFHRTPKLKSLDMEDLSQKNHAHVDIGIITTEGEEDVDFFQDPFGNLEAHRQTTTACTLEDSYHILEDMIQKVPEYKKEDSTWSKEYCISSPLPQKAKGVKQDTVKTTGYSTMNKGFERTPMLKSLDMEDLIQKNHAQGDLGGIGTEVVPFGNLEAHRQTTTACTLEDYDHILEDKTQKGPEYKGTQQQQSLSNMRAPQVSHLPGKTTL